MTSLRGSSQLRDQTQVSCSAWRRQWQRTPVLLPGKSHGQKSLVGCSPWGPEESDTTKWLHFHFLLLCIGEGMATHFSVLAWRIPGMAGWAAVYGVAQSRTWLKRLSSNSSIMHCRWILYHLSHQGSHITDQCMTIKFPNANNHLNKHFSLSLLKCSSFMTSLRCRCFC